MAPNTSNKTPRSAYHLYFRFYRNILQCPSLRMDSIDMGETTADFYKSYVKVVLDTDVEDLPVEIDGARQKFFGSDSFAGMSKKVSQKWKEANELTRSVFKELAKEDRERYKRELFDSYQSFTKELSTSVPVTAVNRSLYGVQPRENDTQVQSHSSYNDVAKKAKSCSEEGSINIVDDVAHSSLKNIFCSSHDRIQEVDMSDEEIIALAVDILVSSPDDPSRDVYQSGASFVKPREDDMAGEEELSDFLLTIDWD